MLERAIAYAVGTLQAVTPELLPCPPRHELVKPYRQQDHLTGGLEATARH